MNGDDLHEPASHTWPDADEPQEQTYCGQCGSDGRPVDPHTRLCWGCIQKNHETVEDVMCPACGGTGEAPDNGTNMGECDECCGSGVLP